MSGSKEAKTSEINSYPKPLVDELEKLYTSIKIKTNDCPHGTSVHAALLMVACDIPAARKVCGFTSYTSTNVRPKCSHQFSQLAGKSSDAEVWRNATTQTERHCLEVENGVCWSELHRLQYFDAVCYTIIDLMHTLLGHCQKNDGEMVVEKMVLLLDYTVLKTKIAKGFPFIKADEWKLWCLIYSPVVLKDVLTPRMYKNWIFFVDTCQQLNFEITYMKAFIEDTWKGNIVCDLLKTANPFDCSSIFSKSVNTLSNTVSHINTTDIYNIFSLLDFLDAAENPYLSICGNEPLPTSTLPLKKNFPNNAKTEIQLFGQVFKRCKGTNRRGSYVQAMLIEGRNGAKYMYVGEIQYLFVHSFSPLVSTPHHGNLQSSQHTFAYIKWCKTSQVTSRQLEGVEVWDPAFSAPDFQSILPVHCFLLPVAIVDFQTKQKVNKKLIIPLPRKINS
ncbi:hypothetical protein PHYBLDRAFT_152955 [Phycomyces blakesleeanus NRRL 1555(-)]|uniref:Uncharacterized protein n=1 Tax=Phycomyces blakesleeanus (strain ATCC 8743b / DSM 1359 / FGSC 10004 / NBRC 33097 / NRRL 1555) TaxID=763407 RepID=A0A167JG96_PHYB8|nr:hypothetical protein PHYBLDRAFT_152955 [Phycomyces blakesleeanus NRRL 1555(-)]OAD65928.1 hypothetical protein PHYBLDRAFT_152955 [Phycomyces blakesleeanus NRRL 1555(-)]|eukprot:XP_018283968.1 hypothetical protein PHYBLDRAFT_152955 [Phycomyces blakesleeanus NRRL 1555(-)]